METQELNREQQRSQNGSVSRQNGSANRTETRIANGLGWFSIGLGLAEIASPGMVAKLIGVNDEDRTRKVLRFYGVRELAAGIGILAQSNPSPWLWARVGGDLLDLSSLGKAMAADGTERTKASVATAAVAGITALDLYCAQRLSAESGRNGNSQSEVSQADSSDISSSIIINRSAEEIYAFWRDFSKLPQVFRHLDSVQVMEGNRSHWKMRSPVGRTSVEWDAELTQDQRNSYLAWRTLSATTSHAGSVRFAPATGGRGTQVTVRIDLTGFGGKLGKLVGLAPEQQINIGLHNLKQLLETGEVVNSDASIHSGMHPAQAPEHYEPQTQAVGAAQGRRYETSQYQEQL